MPDYSANCFKGCGRTAVVIEGDERFCARCSITAMLRAATVRASTYVAERVR